MKWNRFFLLCSMIAVFALAAGAARAGDIDPNLLEQMAAAKADDYLDAYVVLKEQISLPTVISEARIAGGGMARRHYEVITQLRDLAEATQAPLQIVLENGRSLKEVRSYRFFWIANSFGVRAKPAFLKMLAEQPEVGTVFLDYPLELIEPISTKASGSGGKTIENGIQITGAPNLWALGIDGTGRLACDQDTGADGTHPAFADRWRGLDAGVDPHAAWFDPLENETFPSESGWNEHGTHTLGTILGDDGAGNQIGMAPGAKWIGAKTIDTGGTITTDAVAAFQWMADPDGNPGTIDDVPDACNNSWGLSPFYHGVPACDSTFWASIDAAEAAGVAVVFAAGNEGDYYGSESLRTPADRITTAYNSFAVGALEQNGTTIAYFSSLGPSGCDHATIKPEVSAVGAEVRSAQPGGGYQLMDGTSMAAPHVTGAIVLLKQAFPDAAPEEIKMGLYMSAIDLGVAGEDNTFGMGRIDVVAAYEFLMDYFVNPDGEVRMDGAFACGDDIVVRVADSDLTGPSVEVEIVSTTEATPEVVTLTATDTAGLYEGSIPTEIGAAGTDGVLQVHDGDDIAVTYVDANDGQGGLNVPKYGEAFMDCAPPTFGGLQTAMPGDNQVTLSWSPATDATAVSYNIYRADTPGGENFTSPSATTTALSYVDSTAINMHTYYYVVRAQDAFGHEETNAVELYVTPVGPVPIFVETWGAKWDHTWQIVDGGSDGYTWTDTNPEGRSFDLMDGTFMICDSDASYSVDMDEQLISEEINVAGYENVFLRLAQVVDTTWSGEVADIDAKFDGGAWTNLARYADADFAEVTEIDLSGYTFATLQLRFHYYDANYAWWWAIDNIQVLGWTGMCDDPEDCVDGNYCNGEETCQDGFCIAGPPPCPNNGLFCDGVEQCNETTDQCSSTGSPCDANETCEEATDECVPNGDDDDDNDDDNDDDDVSPDDDDNDASPDDDDASPDDDDDNDDNDDNDDSDDDDDDASPPSGDDDDDDDSGCGC